MTYETEALPPQDDRVGINEYAAANNVSTRTVKRWLADNELPGAEKDPFTGAWRIPLHAVRQLRALPADHTQPQTHSEVGPAGGQLIELMQRQGGMMLQQPSQLEPSLREDLDDEPGYLTLAAASRYLGIPQAQILANAEKFGVEHVGTNGSARVPQRIVRRIAGY